MNNKGQTLVLFIFLIPIILFVSAFIIDTGIIYYETNKLNNLNKNVLKYGLDNNEEEKIRELIFTNDKNITNYKIIIDNNILSIILEKEIDSIFGKIIGINSYNINSYYTGYKEENKYYIERSVWNGI